VEDFTELVADPGVAAGYDEDFAGLWGEVGFGESRGRGAQLRPVGSEGGHGGG